MNTYDLTLQIAQAAKFPLTDTQDQFIEDCTKYPRWYAHVGRRSGATTVAMMLFVAQGVALLDSLTGKLAPEDTPFDNDWSCGSSEGKIYATDAFPNFKHKFLTSNIAHASHLLEVFVECLRHIDPSIRSMKSATGSIALLRDNVRVNLQVRSLPTPLQYADKGYTCVADLSNSFLPKGYNIPGVFFGNRPKPDSWNHGHGSYPTAKMREVPEERLLKFYTKQEIG